MIAEKENNTTEEKEAIAQAAEKKLENMNIYCSKHGLINNGAFYTRYTNLQKDGEKTVAVDNNNIFCVACLNELYQKFQKSGDIGKISVDVIYEKENNEGEDKVTEEKAE